MIKGIRKNHKRLYFIAHGQEWFLSSTCFAVLLGDGFSLLILEKKFVVWKLLLLFFMNITIVLIVPVYKDLAKNILNQVW